MKLNKTLINRLLKGSLVIQDEQEENYLFRGDNFRAILPCAPIDEITSKVSERAQYGDVFKADLSEIKGKEISNPLHLKDYKNFVSNDEARPLLCALHFTDTKIAATDSYRLIEGNNYSGITGNYDYKALELVGLFDLKNGIQTESGELYFGDSLSIVPTPGEYPNYEMLFPSGDPVKVTTCPLPKTLNNPYSHNDNTPMIRLDGNTAQVHVSNGKGARVSILTLNNHLTPKSSEKIELNYQYFKQLMDVLGNEIEVTFIGELKPLTVSDDKYRAILMPVRFDNGTILVRGEAK